MGFVEFLAGTRERCSTEFFQLSRYIFQPRRDRRTMEFQVFREVARDLRLRVYAACKMPRCFIHPLIYGEI